jgi:hypothetical protein
MEIIRITLAFVSKIMSWVIVIEKCCVPYTLVHSSSHPYMCFIYFIYYCICSKNKSTYKQERRQAKGFSDFFFFLSKNF